MGYVQDMQGSYKPLSHYNRLLYQQTMVWSTSRRPGAGRSNSEPGPQSLQSASEARLHVSAQIGGGGGKRGPQSAQSVP
jgi:hypothetical protein